MVRSVEDYVQVVGDKTISSIYKKASKLYSKHVCNVNSTFIGGGVAELLSKLMPLMNEIGLDAGWRVIHGNPAYFNVTKAFHNALQGGKMDLTEAKKRIYLGVNHEFSVYTHIDDSDAIIIHDPQPLPLIKYYKKRQPWIWRCHIDFTEPNKELLDFLKTFLIRYDMVIFSNDKFKKKNFPVEQRVIYPAIDPLSLKNRDLSDAEIARCIKEAGIPTDKPLISQVSRMDPWKDPEGVLKVFQLVKEKVDCRLLYCYNLAADDPEGMDVYARVRRKGKKLIENNDLLFVVGNDDMLVNSIQRISSVILQKSIKEGFGLTITESLWKGKPVVASNVGGIPIQIKDGENGFLIDPHDYRTCADRIIEILKKPSLTKKLGKSAKEHVKKRFLLPRLLSDYLDLLSDVIK